ncbi:hypothetical protein BGX30_012656 [Mortierella sp. GBA39]|nr:hypothetical protein BGX30_012656 [Mortierella sp. GBA39]
MPVYYNLAVKAKTVYQPQFRFRMWLEAEKMSRSEGEEESVSDIESRLPPLRGESAGVIDYIDELKRVEARLKTFYTCDGGRYRRYIWEMERARQEEFNAIAERLLNVVGGSQSRRVGDGPDADPILIGIGLCKFFLQDWSFLLGLLFLTYFVRTAHALGYEVVRLNEHHTSKKCPRCEQFVAQVTFRSLYCFPCKRNYLRDTTATERMSRIVLERLQNQERPIYLQPINADAHTPGREHLPLLPTRRPVPAPPLRRAVSAPRV